MKYTCFWSKGPSKPNTQTWISDYANLNPYGYVFDFCTDIDEDGYEGNYCVESGPVPSPDFCGKVYCNEKFDDGIHSVYGIRDNYGEVYDPIGKYYGLCYNSNGINNILMFKCSKGAYFGGAKREYGQVDCCYSCEDEGKFANSNDPSTYYLCYSDSTGGSTCSDYNYEIIDCPKGYHFNQKTGFCDIKIMS